MASPSRRAALTAGDQIGQPLRRLRIGEPLFERQQPCAKLLLRLADGAQGGSRLAVNTGQLAQPRHRWAGRQFLLDHAKVTAEFGGTSLLYPALDRQPVGIALRLGNGAATLDEILDRRRSSQHGGIIDERVDAASDVGEQRCRHDPLPLGIVEDEEGREHALLPHRRQHRHLASRGEPGMQLGAAAHGRPDPARRSTWRCSAIKVSRSASAARRAASASCSAACASLHALGLTCRSRASARLAS